MICTDNFRLFFPIPTPFFKLCFLLEIKDKEKMAKKRCYVMPLNIHTLHTYSIAPLSLLTTDPC